MQTRANALGIVGVVIEGKCRDVVELDSVPNIPVFATGTSTLGASGYLKVAEVGQPVHLNVGKYGGPSREWQVVVENGDLIMADIDGVVRIPKNRVEDVLRICQDAVRRDEKCKEAVADGMTIFDAFKKFRQS
ncbi:hypothetical protein HK098_002901 [Nowakowskiella sp. JEL0407]|nr:hypothetical protein HK098_004233 [Nowakowskiella sp. JEL0407]KAJ3122383.1 hypothetical protein HK098_002901 [Nowakowskiella sp. JEL0407]